MIIRVLIINRQLVFAVTIKQALEQTGAFEVHPFTDPNAAVEYLRSHPHDVALVDFDIQVQPGPEIVAQLRAVQPDIALIVNPTQPASVLQQLNIQDTVDTPFSARGIIPVLERAVEQVVKPTSAITRSLVQPDEVENQITDVLPDERSDSPTDKLPAQTPTPAETNILDDDESEDDSSHGDIEPAQTRILDDDEDDDVPSTPDGTRIFDDEQSDEWQPEGDVEPAQTRILDDEGDDDVPPTPAGTRIFDDEQPDEAPPAHLTDQAQTRILDDDDESPVPSADDIATRVLDNEKVDAPSPSTLPEFSSLDHVLTDEAPSALFEPPVRDDDTPAVPEAESDAVRQYLATTSDPEDSFFDDMLSAIPSADSAPEQSPESSDFDNLVNSMRAETPHTPLPDRHQQFVEFILTGGMDHLLTEIGQAHDEPPDLPEFGSDSGDTETLPTDLFQRLLEEEPPMPSLEDSGHDWRSDGGCQRFQFSQCPGNDARPGID